MEPIFSQLEKILNLPTVGSGKVVNNTCYGYLSIILYRPPNPDQITKKVLELEGPLPSADPSISAFLAKDDDGSLEGSKLSAVSTHFDVVQDLTVRSTRFDSLTLCPSHSNLINQNSSNLGPPNL